MRGGGALSWPAVVWLLKWPTGMNASAAALRTRFGGRHFGTTACESGRRAVGRPKYGPCTMLASATARGFNESMFHHNGRIGEAVLLLVARLGGFQGLPKVIGSCGLWRRSTASMDISIILLVVGHPANVTPGLRLSRSNKAQPGLGD